MIAYDFRVVTREVDRFGTSPKVYSGLSWIYRDNKEYCGPFRSRADALATVSTLQAAQETIAESSS